MPLRFTSLAPPPTNSLLTPAGGPGWGAQMESEAVNCGTPRDPQKNRKGFGGDGGLGQGVAKKGWARQKKHAT